MSHDVYAATRGSRNIGFQFAKGRIRPECGPVRYTGVFARWFGWQACGALAESRRYFLRFARSRASILLSAQQFTTSSLVSQPLRAMPMPNHRSRKRSVR